MPARTLTLHTNSQSNSQNCLIHVHAKHSTEECKVFHSMSMNKRFKLAKTNRACFKCFGVHKRKDCKLKNSCSNCNDNYHHLLLCNRQKDHAEVENACHKAVGTIVNNNLVQPTVEEIIFPAQEAPVEGLNATALLMYDSGSNSSYISLDAVQRIQAKPVKSNISLSVAVLGGKTKNLKQSYIK